MERWAKRLTPDDNLLRYSQGQSTVITLLRASSSLDNINVYLNLHLIAPFTLKIQLLPRSLDINFKDMRVDFADTNRVHRQDLAMDCNKDGIHK